MHRSTDAMLDCIVIMVLCNIIVDIDECLEAALSSVDLCDQNSQCVNSDGSFSCICVPGYEEINGTCSRE